MPEDNNIEPSIKFLVDYFTRYLRMPNDGGVKSYSGKKRKILDEISPERIEAFQKIFARQIREDAKTYHEVQLEIDEEGFFPRPGTLLNALEDSKIIESITKAGGEMQDVFQPAVFLVLDGKRGNVVEVDGDKTTVIFDPKKRPNNVEKLADFLSEELMQYVRRPTKDEIKERQAIGDATLVAPMRMALLKKISPEWLPEIKEKLKTKISVALNASSETVAILNQKSPILERDRDYP